MSGTLAGTGEEIFFKPERSFEADKKPQASKPLSFGLGFKGLGFRVYGLGFSLSRLGNAGFSV